MYIKIKNVKIQFVNNIKFLIRCEDSFFKNVNLVYVIMDSTYLCDSSYNLGKLPDNMTCS